MISFLKNKAQATVRHIKPPTVLVAPQALEDMGIIIEEVDTEVGWLGSVDVTEGNDFIITEVFLPKQNVNGGTTEIDPEGYAELAQELMATRENGLDVVNGIRFWGHSHVNMGTGPSGQDDSQLVKLAEMCEDYFIAARGNKQGELRFDVLYGDGLLIENLPWRPLVENSERLEMWRGRIKEKVSILTYQSATYVASGGRWNPKAKSVFQDEWTEREWADFMAAQGGEVAAPENIGNPAFAVATKALPRGLSEDEEEALAIISDAEYGPVEPEDAAFAISMAMEAGVKPLEYFAPKSIGKNDFVDWAGRTRPLSAITGLELEAAGWEVKATTI